MVMQVEKGSLTPDEQQFFADHGIAVVETSFAREQPFHRQASVAREYQTLASAPVEVEIEIIVD